MNELDNNKLMEKIIEIRQQLKELKEQTLNECLRNNKINYMYTIYFTKIDPIAEELGIIRNNIIDEINELINIFQSRLDKVSNVERKFFEDKYCSKYGHHFVSRDYSKQNGIVPSIESYKCSNCGKVIFDRPRIVKNQSNIKEFHLQNKIFFEEVEEIENILYNKISYLKSLKEKICQIFGHEFLLVKSTNLYYSVNNDEICGCCGKRFIPLNWKESVPRLHLKNVIGKCNNLDDENLQKLLNIVVELIQFLKEPDLELEEDLKKLK